MLFKTVAKLISPYNFIKTLLMTSKFFGSKKSTGVGAEKAIMFLVESSQSLPPCSSFIESEDEAPAKAATAAPVNTSTIVTGYFQNNGTDVRSFNSTSFVCGQQIEVPLAPKGRTTYRFNYSDQNTNATVNVPVQANTNFILDLTTGIAFYIVEKIVKDPQSGCYYTFTITDAPGMQVQICDPTASGPAPAVGM